MGLLFVLPGNDVSEKPGNSPCFQCFFLTTEEELEADAEGGDEIAKRVMGKIGTLGLGLRVLLNLCGEIGEGAIEEENVREREAISIDSTA